MRIFTKQVPGIDGAASTTMRRTVPRAFTAGGIARGMASPKGVLAIGAAGSISALFGVMGAISQANRQRPVVARASAPRMGTPGQRYNLGVDPFAGMRFSTMRRRPGAF